MNCTTCSFLMLETPRRAECWNPDCPGSHVLLHCDSHDEWLDEESFTLEGKRNDQCEECQRKHNMDEHQRAYAQAQEDFDNDRWSTDR